MNSSIDLTLIIILFVWGLFHTAKENKLQDLLYSKFGKLIIWCIVVFLLYYKLHSGIILAFIVFVYYNNINFSNYLKTNSFQNGYNMIDKLELMTTMDKTSSLSDPKNPIKKFTSLTNNNVNKENLKEALKPIDSKTIDVNTKALKTNTDNVVPLLPSSIENTTPL